VGGMIMKLKDFIRERLLTMRNNFNWKSDYCDAGMSQKILADSVGVSANTIDKWESGEDIIRPQNILDLSKALHTSVAEFFPPGFLDDRLNLRLYSTTPLSDEDVKYLTKYNEHLAATRVEE
jgi:transcriptional regulator with XRE-family HTH domain